MIDQLRISDLGVIAEATLDLDPRLTVVTGETGAGKTMIITGLGLLSGRRADPGDVRTGAERARVEGRIDLADDLPNRAEVIASVVEVGGEVDDNELILTRQVGAQGRSRCWVAGAGVPVGRCAELAMGLITIHGQSEQLRLADPDRQRELLDRAGGDDIAELTVRYGELWQERRAVATELRTLRDDAQAREREIDMLQFALAEIAATDPQPGEDDDLTAEAARLQSVDELRLDAQTGIAALTGDSEDGGSGVLAAIALTERSLVSLAEHDDAVRPWVDAVRQAALGLSEVSAELARYLDRLEADPERLEAVMQRRAALATLLRKYGSTTAEVVDWAAEQQQRLADLQGGDERIGQLADRHDRLTEELEHLAGELTAARRASARRVADEVAGELAALAMPRARLEFAVTPAGELGPWGADTIELRFAANPGTEPRPIQKAASGGELSRVRLALEVVLATDTQGRTLVFDEVDAGIGGAVAVEVGRRLARLADRCQVIVVTHLAQVAAFADRHLVVTKTDDGAITTSGVRQVADDERAGELSRMMSGLGDTSAALDHARELLTMARGG